VEKLASVKTHRIVLPAIMILKIPIQLLQLANKLTQVSQAIETQIKYLARLHKSELKALKKVLHIGAKVQVI
jgi:hypothetical protein